MRLVLRRWLIRSPPSRSRPRGLARVSMSWRRSCTPSTTYSSSTTPGRIRANPRKCREPGLRQLTAHRYYSRNVHSIQKLQCIFFPFSEQNSWIYSCFSIWKLTISKTNSNSLKNNLLILYIGISLGLSSSHRFSRVF